MYSDIIKASASQNGLLVEARAYYLGDDIVVSVGGGTQYHIGAVSIAVFEPERVLLYPDIVSSYFNNKSAILSFW